MRIRTSLIIQKAAVAMFVLVLCVSLLVGCGGFGVADNTAVQENEHQGAVETVATSAPPETKTETEPGGEDTTEPEAGEGANAPPPAEGEVNQEASTTAKQPAPGKKIGNNASKTNTNSNQKTQSETQKPETSSSTTAPSSGGTSGGGGNSTTPIIGVIGSGGQSPGGTDQPQGSGVVGVVGGQQTHVHSYSRQVVAPTCSERGYTIFTCSCGESYTGDYTSATGQHRWVMDYDYVPVYEKRGICVCNVCGKDITDMSLEQHYFQDGCFGSWHSETIKVEVGTSYEVVGCHCEDCGKIRGE